MSERWKPEKYEWYWIIAFSEVVQSEWRADCADLIRWRMGNCFKTKEEAADALKKITALLLSLHDNGTSIDNSETSKGTFTEYLKKCAELQSDMLLQKVRERKLSEQYGNAHEEKTLPDWCRVTSMGWHKRCGYFKVTYIDNVSKRVDIQQVEDRSKGYLSFNTVYNEAIQARLRHYTDEEMRELVGKVVKDRNDNLYLVVTYNYRGRGLLIGSYYFNAQEIINTGFTINGKPCGVLEHLNEKGEWVE